MLTLSDAFGREFRGKSSGIPHLAKNERDVGHPGPRRGKIARPVESVIIEAAAPSGFMNARYTTGTSFHPPTFMVGQES